MKRFYAFILAMVLIVSSFMFSACSSQDGGMDAGNGNGTASDQTQQNDNGMMNNNGAVEKVGDDVKRTVDDVVDAGQR